MQPSIFNPWAWRDPSALAGGYTQTTPSVTPPEGQDGGHDGPDAPGPGTPVDLVGYQVQASDGRIGTIDEASNEADAGLPGGGHRAVDLRPEGAAAGRHGGPGGSPGTRRARRPDPAADQGRTAVRCGFGRPGVPGARRRLLRRQLPSPSRGRPAGNLRPWSGRATARRRRSTWSTASRSVPCPGSRPAPAMAVSNF